MESFKVPSRHLPDTTTKNMVKLTQQNGRLLEANRKTSEWKGDVTVFAWCIWINQEELEPPHTLIHRYSEPRHFGYGDQLSLRISAHTLQLIEL